MREGATDLDAVRELKSRTVNASEIPALILHGNEDSVVHRRNAELLVRQYLGWNNYFPDSLDWASVPLPPARDAQMRTQYGHSYVLRDYGEGILPPVRECEVVGMGHAWSGGDSALPFHDELGPDASALMMEFFSGVAERGP
jgi:poly(3-hydroxybutyrate) depolymerase